MVQPEPDSRTRLSAGVWATFPGSFGWLLKWMFTYLFRGVDKDREHARTELRYRREFSKPPTRRLLNCAFETPTVRCPSDSRK